MCRADGHALVGQCNLCSNDLCACRDESGSRCFGCCHNHRVHPKSKEAEYILRHNHLVHLVFLTVIIDTASPKSSPSFVGVSQIFFWILAKHLCCGHLGPLSQCPLHVQHFILGNRKELQGERSGLYGDRNKCVCLCVCVVNSLTASDMCKRVLSESEPVLLQSLDTCSKRCLSRLHLLLSLGE